MKGRPKGTRKTGGRAKGTPNRVTKNIRGYIEALIDSQRDRLAADFEAVEPMQRLVIFERLLPYVIPKCKDVQEQNLSPIEQFFAERNRQINERGDRG
jgi:hypothetical protein